MNKSLELNFWPIVYVSRPIVFLCLPTQKVYQKQNTIYLTFMMGQKLSSKLLFSSSPNTDGFYTSYISQGSVAT